MAGTSQSHPITDAVTAQYEQWSYPPPYTDLEALPLNEPESNFKDFRALHLAYWPAESYHEDRDILVAGCGTMAAACYAWLYPKARVVGIDLSSTSLAHEQLLKEKYRLANLTLHRLPLEQVGSLGITFDFIACHGVLHHLADPVAGLSALRDVLKIDGVATLMVYAKYGRLGVYMLQDFFRLLGFEQDATGVADIKQTLSLISPNHPVQQYLRVAIDLNSDAGLVDTFLHPRDRAYSVRDCLDLVRGAGMAFQGWEESMRYNCDLPFANLPSDNSLFQRMAALPEEKMWEAAELFRGNVPVHFFYACRADRDPLRYRIHFEGEDFLGYVPVPRFSRVTSGDPQQGRPTILQRPLVPPVAVAPAHIPVLQQIDGTRTVAECLRAQPLSGEAGVLFGRQLFSYYWRQGYLLFRLPQAH